MIPKRRNKRESKNIETADSLKIGLNVTHSRLLMKTDVHHKLCNVVLHKVITLLAVRQISKISQNKAIISFQAENSCVMNTTQCSGCEIINISLRATDLATDNVTNQIFMICCEKILGKNHHFYVSIYRYSFKLFNDSRYPTVYI